MCPDLREGLGSTCDIGGNIRSIIDEFSNLFPNLETKKLDDLIN